MSGNEPPKHAIVVDFMKKIADCTSITELNSLKGGMNKSVDDLIELLKENPHHKYQEAYISLVKEILSFYQDKAQQFKKDKEKFDQKIFNIITGLFIFITTIGTFGQFMLELCKS